VISGECRVDAIPPSGGEGAGHRLSIDGLRLRLDLRIVPGPPGTDGTAAAVWRIEDAATLPLFGLPFHVPAAFRRAAVVSSFAVLGLALVVWFAGGHHAPVVTAPDVAAPVTAPARPPLVTASPSHPPAAVQPVTPSSEQKVPEQVPAMKAEPAVAPWGDASAAGASRSVPAHAESAEGVAPRIRALPPSGPGREVSGVMANEPATPSAGVRPAVRSDGRQPEAARVPARPAPGRGRLSDAVTGSANAQRDLLELFGDTK
jgi:hypothetical protein